MPCNFDFFFQNLHLSNFVKCPLKIDLHRTMQKTKGLKFKLHKSLHLYVIVLSYKLYSFFFSESLKFTSKNNDRHYCCSTFIRNNPTPIFDVLFLGHNFGQKWQSYYSCCRPFNETWLVEKWRHLNAN